MVTCIHCENVRHHIRSFDNCALEWITELAAEVEEQLLGLQEEVDFPGRLLELQEHQVLWAYYHEG